MGFPYLSHVEITHGGDDEIFFFKNEIVLEYSD